MKYTDTHTAEIDLSLISGYVLQRSRENKFKFDCYAIDNNGKFLFRAATNLPLEKAQAYVEAINQEYYPVVPTETELVEIQLAEENRIFKVAKD